MIIIKKILLSLIVTLLVIFFLKLIIDYRGKKEFLSLIEGKSIINISYIQLEGQGRTMNIYNPLILKYIKNELSKGRTADSSPNGLIYYGRVHFSPFSQFNIECYATTEGKFLAFGYKKSTDFYEYFIVEIGKKSPKEIINLLNYLSSH